jgi:hypothetical protein
LQEDEQSLDGRLLSKAPGDATSLFKKGAWTSSAAGLANSIGAAMPL